MDLVPPSLSYAAAAMAAAFVAAALWEHARPAQPPSVPDGPRWRVNLILFAIRKLIATALAPLIAVAMVVPLSGAALLPLPESAVGAVVHAGAVLLVLDLGNYLAHRALHAVPWLWRLHAVHHTDLDLDVTTSVRGHPAEPILVGLCLAALGGVLGAGPEEMGAYAALGFAVQLVAHGNVRLAPRLQSALDWLLITPAFHHWHHSRDERECQANFGTVLVLWDRMFGTAIQPAGRPAAYGVAGYLEPQCQRLGSILLQPLRPPPASGAGAASPLQTPATPRAGAD